MATEMLRAGVIGTGQWARVAHLPAYQSLPGVEVVALAGIDQAEAKAAAADFGVQKIYDSGQAMIANEPLDLVSIVTPDDCHVTDARVAIAAGLNVLCEKPLASNVRDARLVAEQAAASQMKTKMGFSLRFSPAVMQLRDMVRDGRIGELQHVQAFQQNGQFLDPDKPFHWKMDGTRTGGGAMVEYGVHTLDLLRWIIEDVTRVAATSRTLVPARTLPEGGIRDVEVDDSTAVLLEFAQGASGVLHAGWSTAGRPPGIELRVFGSRGAVKCVLSDDLPGGEGLWFADSHEQRFTPADIPTRNDNDSTKGLPWWRHYTQALIQDFIGEINGRTAPSATFADGYAAQLLLDAVLIASRERRWVDVAS
jgi:predicted dehydrogenase